jgi:hypothetical protein
VVKLEAAPGVLVVIDIVLIIVQTYVSYTVNPLKALNHENSQSRDNAA